MEHLDVYNLWLVMPEHIRYCLRMNGDPSVTGFWVADLKKWLETSTIPEVEKWRTDLKAYARAQYERGLRRQKIMNDAAGEFYGGENGLIRHRGVIDPVVMAHNRKCFDNPEAIRDTEKKEPKLFIK